MLSAAALIDLSTLDCQAARRRCAALSTVPNDARLILLVGALAPMYEVVTLLAEHIERLNVEVYAEPWNAERWLVALRGNWPWDVSP